MSKSKELKTVTDIVKKVLIDVPEARGSDDCLLVEVYGRINPTVIDCPFVLVLQNRKEFGLPPYKSVDRARRKLQSIYPELAANATVEAFRIENEEVYKDYARRHTV